MTNFKETFAKNEIKQADLKVVNDSKDHRRTLKDLKVGDVAHIVGFIQQSETVQKIEAMGLRPGKKITVMQKLGRGILVKASNSRIVITSDVAKNIEVK